MTFGTDLRATTSKKGAALVEYGILAGLISVVSISSVLALGSKVDEIFSSAGQTLASKVQSSSTVEASAPEPAPEETLAFSFLTGTANSGSTHFYGIGNNPDTSAIRFGTFHDDMAYDLHVMSLYNNSVNTKTLMIILGDRRGDIPYTSLTCNGEAYQVPASGIYNTSKDYTTFTWNGGVRPVFTVGVETTCTFGS